MSKKPPRAKLIERENRGPFPPDAHPGPPLVVSTTDPDPSSYPESRCAKRKPIHDRVTEDEVLGMIEAGYAIRRILRDPLRPLHWPSWTEWVRWVHRDSGDNADSLWSRYTRARDRRREVMLEETIDIADEARHLEDAATIARARLRVDARQWYIKTLGGRYQETVRLEAGDALSSKLEELSRRLHERDDKHK